MENFSNHSKYHWIDWDSSTRVGKPPLASSERAWQSHSAEITWGNPVHLYDGRERHFRLQPTKTGLFPLLHVFLLSTRQALDGYCQRQSTLVLRLASFRMCNIVHEGCRINTIKKIDERRASTVSMQSHAKLLNPRCDTFQSSAVPAVWSELNEDERRRK